MKTRNFVHGERWNWYDISGIAVPYFITPAIRFFAATVGAFAPREGNSTASFTDKSIDRVNICAMRLQNDLAVYGIRVVKLSDKLMLESSGIDGLAVYVFPERRRTTVAFGGWYDDFFDFEALSSFVRRASTGQIRLRVDVIDGRPFRWTVEANDRGNWLEENVMEDAFGPKSGGNIISHYLQNGLHKS